MSDYDSKAIEDRAVIEVLRYFETSKVVATYINMGDREPFFDGHLYLYHSGKRDNEHYTGRVAAQVKGKDLGVFKDGVFSYPIEMTALKAYLHEGVAYFVVQEVKRKKKLFYKLLTPVELRTIISEKGENDSYSVRMKYAPDRDIKNVELELIQFEQDCKKQISFADAKPLDFSDLDKLGIHSFSVNVAVKDKKEPFYVAVTEKPVYLYANLNENIQVPLGFGPANIALMRNVEQPVIVGGKEYFKQFHSEIKGGFLTVKVGDCFSITFDPSGKKNQATLNVGRRATMLKDIIREAEFLLALQSNKEIKIGSLTLPIPFPDTHPLTEGLSDNLKAWHELDSTLAKISCNKDVDMSIVKKKDETTIDILIDMVGHGNERSLKGVTLGVNNIKLANLNLWLVIYKNEHDKHVIKSFFDPALGMQVSYKYPEGSLSESLYSWFDRQKIMDCDNLPYDDVIPSYELLKDVNPHIYERANSFLLELIAAYDKETDNQKKQLLYDTATKINQWLMANDLKENRTVHRLNLYQILKRSPGLKEEDVAELKKIQIENSRDDQVQYAVALLLGDKDTYEYYWKKLDAETQKAYQERMPIYIFHL